MVDLGFAGPSKPANDYRFVKVSDGDTPTVEMPIRMVSIDTPETSYGGNPATAQAALERAETRLADGTCWPTPRPGSPAPPPIRCRPATIRGGAPSTST
jgi:endonuclease YncB( thermonuclease family)